ncbi:MAG: hypothetical protein QNJ74_04715 [Trichodesmium sp. MO_231.B1]|nr:hypothetical protein [Trichodesmium sp. MO_231.B1]
MFNPVFSTKPVGHFSYQLASYRRNCAIQLSVSLLSEELRNSVPLAEASGLTSGIVSFFIPLKREASDHNFSVKEQEWD